MNKWRKKYIVSQVELFASEPKLLDAWLYAKPNKGRTPPTNRLDNVIWWVLKLSGYIQD